MSDNTSGDSTSSATSGSNSADGSTQTTPEFVTREQFKEFEKNRNWSQTKFKEIDSTLSEIKALLTGSKPDGGGSGSSKGGKSGEGDERIASAEKTINELKQKLEGAEKEAKRARNRDRLIEKIKDKVRPDLQSAFLRLEADNFDDVEVDGSLTFGVVKEPYTSVDDYIDSFLEREPAFKANKRAPGTGDSQKGVVGNGGSVDVAQLEKMSVADREAAFRKDPKLRQRFAEERARGQ